MNTRYWLLGWMLVGWTIGWLLLTLIDHAYPADGLQMEGMMMMTETKPGWPSNMLAKTQSVQLSEEEKIKILKEQLDRLEHNQTEKQELEAKIVELGYVPDKRTW